MKKENFFRVFFIIFFVILTVCAIFRAKPTETSLISAFSASGEKSNQLLKIANISSLRVNAIFESSSQENVENLKSEFEQKISKTDIKEENIDFSKILKLYSEAPENFLSKKDKILLEKKEYSVVEKNALNSIYNPLGIFILTPDKDPYMLVTDFVTSLRLENPQSSDDISYNGKFYSILRLKLSSVNYANSQVKKLISTQKELNTVENSQIYLEGTPIHSYFESSKSSNEINFICIISSLALVLLCKFYFKSYRVLFPISISILFGIVFGALVTTVVFGSVHVLTFVFSTSLIGIGLDYSIHYILTGNEKNFNKNLFSSMITTVFAFMILIFSGLKILMQIAIFTGFGLLGIFCFVKLFLPIFKSYCKFENFEKFRSLNLLKYKKPLLFLIGIIIILGAFNVTFDDSLKNLYNPPKNLLKTEILYKNVFKIPQTTFIVVKGTTFEEILQKSEKVCTYLSSQKIPYFGANNILPSVRTQRTNFGLVQNLYYKNLDKYALFLDKNTIFSLRKNVKIFNPVYFDVKNYPILSDFVLDKNSGFLIVFTSKTLDLSKFSGVNQVNVSKDMSLQIRDCRIKCLKILPIMFLGLFGFLAILYGVKKALKIFIPPTLGTVFPICFLGLINHPLNLFNILSLVLIMGFSLDYSIFRASGNKKSNDAVLISCISTVFSFFLLSLTSFKLISSLGETLFLGILTSYILSLLLISPSDEETEQM